MSIAELTADKLGAGQEAGVSALGTDSAFSNGDLVINGEGVRASSATDDSYSTSGADRSARSKAAAINDDTSVTGVAAEINVNVAAGTAQVPASTSGSITLNGVTIDIATGGVDAAADRATVLQAINAVSEQTHVIAVDTGNDESGITLETLAVNDENLGLNIELRYDKFDASGNAFASGLTAESTGLASGGSGSTSGATAEAAVITAVGSVGALTTLNGAFDLAIDGNEQITVTLTGTGNTIDKVVSSLQSSINTAISTNGLDVSVTVSHDNGVVSITSDSIGEDSSLIITGVTQAAAADVDLADILGYVTTGGVFGAGGLTAADVVGMYLDDKGSNGIENTAGTYVGGVNLATTAGAVLAELTIADAIFSIEVDGGNLVAVSVLQEGAAIATVSDLTSYAQKVEDQINSALSADGQTGRVDVSLSDTYRLVIESTEEGTDSAIRITATASGSAQVGIISHTAGPLSNNGAVGTNGVENASETYEGSITLRSVNGDDIDITAGSGDLATTGLQSGSFNAGQAFASSQSQSVGGAIATSGIVVGERLSTGGLDDAFISNIAANVTVSFTIEVDGGNEVTVSYIQATATVTEFDSLDNYINGLEEEINSSLATDGQTGTVSVSINDDNQVVIASNTKGDSSSIEITAVNTTTGQGSAISILGVTDNNEGFGSSGAVATQGQLTSTGAIEGSSLGQVFSTALLGLGGTILSETIRISVDGADTIDATIALHTAGDAASALAFVESEINDELADAGQTGRVSLALDADGFVTITSDKVGAGSSIEILANNTATQTFSTIAGLQDYAKSSVAVGTVSTPNGLDSGDLLLNGVAIESAKASDDTASNSLALSSSKQASGIATAAAINRVSDQTGIQATVNTTSLAGGTQTATLPTDTNQQGSIVINGVETSTITTNGANGGADDRAATISAINAISGQTGVTAIDDGKGITLEAADGRNISVVIDNAAKAAEDSGGSILALTGAAIGLNVAEADISGGATFAATAQTTYSTVTLDGPGVIDVKTGANGAAALEEIGFRVGEYGSTEAGTRLSDLDITTVAGAELAIKALDNAIGSVASQRADLGAIQNRLDSTVNNLSLTSINLQAANSRIQDADFAAETAELSRSQVLQQAGISILAQANAAPQQVLSLLG